MTDETTKPTRATLKACVERIKAASLTGKARDDAARHFLAGVQAAGGGELPEGAKYVDVLEALADAD